MNYTQLQSVLAANITAQTIAQRDYKEAQAEADKWKKIYQLALKEGREDFVREAEFRKNIYVKKACNIKALLDEQTERVANLRHKLILKKQIKVDLQTTAKLPTNNFQMRLRKVESELETMNNQLLSQQLGISKLIKQNSAILEDVRELLSETAFDATFELTNVDEINQLIDLEPEIDIDDELENLKQALTISTTSQNYNSQAATKTVQVVDGELEQLRSQLDKL